MEIIKSRQINMYLWITINSINTHLTSAICQVLRNIKDNVENKEKHLNSESIYWCLSTDFDVILNLMSVINVTHQCWWSGVFCVLFLVELSYLSWKSLWGRGHDPITWCSSLSLLQKYICHKYAFIFQFSIFCIFST